MIHTLLSPHKYYIPHKKLVGEILATRGIRQASKDGPILWTLCMHLVLSDLAARYSCTWLHDHVIIYADDVHLRWSTQRMSDGLIDLSDLDHILRVFRLYGFTINLDKSVVLFRAVGKGASKFTKWWVIRTKAGPFLTMPDSSIRLPMVSENGIPRCDNRIQSMADRHSDSTSSGSPNVILHFEEVAHSPMCSAEHPFLIVPAMHCAHNHARHP